jgi:citrate synthase
MVDRLGYIVNLDLIINISKDKTLSEDKTLSAKEAAEHLGVSLATLYAYVSRGLIRSEARGAARDRRYVEADIRTLLERKAQRREPARAARQALSWGPPVLESAVSTIQDGQLYYRGKNAVNLAYGSSFEEVVGLLWNRPMASPSPSVRLAEPSHCFGAIARATPLGRFSCLLPIAALADEAALDPRPEAIARAGTRILRFLARHAVADPAPGVDEESSLAKTLARGWQVNSDSSCRAIEAALILAADHELNISSFTARCVASAGASPYAVVSAGLAALQGARHGGHCERVEALFEEVREPDRARDVLVGRLRRGEMVPGFGHPLYPLGDPRGKALLALCEQRADGRDCLLANALSEAAQDLDIGFPTIDFGLVALARVLALPHGTPLALFALGRTAGWIAHALEQTEQGSLIRPRAEYVGPAPVNGE